MNHSSKERGQALVIIVLAIVAIFGFAALALDFGRYFSERRRAQNAADAAAYAAAYAGVSQAGNAWRTAGVNSTQLNGFNDSDWDENVNADVDVRVHHPPIRGRYATATDAINPNEYYQVIIRQRVDQIFSQFVYSGDLWVEVEAIARSTVQGGFGAGGAMVAVCPNCCSAVQLTGNGTTNIVNGMVVSSSVAANDPLDQSACHSGEITNNTTVNMTNGSMMFAGSLYQGNHLSFPFTVSSNTTVPSNYSYPFTPTCADLPPRGSMVLDGNNDYTLEPGVYSSITVNSRRTNVTLNSGMYCLDGDFRVNSGSLVGSNVMIVMRSGALLIITNQSVSLSAPTAPNVIIEGSQTWSGFLVFMPVTNTSPVYVAGGGSTSYTGTIYAPGELNPSPYNISGHGSVSHKCTLRGGSDVNDRTEFNSSIICYTVQVAGGNEVTVRNDSNNNAQQPGTIELPE